MAAIPFRLILWLFFGYSDLLDGPDVWHGPHESNVCANCSVLNATMTRTVWQVRFSTRFLLLTHAWGMVYLEPTRVESMKGVVSRRTFAPERKLCVQLLGCGCGKATLEQLPWCTVLFGTS